MEKFKGGVHDHTPNPDNVPLTAIQKKNTSMNIHVNIHHNQQQQIILPL